MFRELILTGATGWGHQNLTPQTRVIEEAFYEHVLSAVGVTNPSKPDVLALSCLLKLLTNIFNPLGEQIITRVFLLH